MNLKHMFEMQKALDDHILDEHPELKGQDNLEWKTLALLVEVGECANEWRGFKKWSKDQQPRVKVKTGYEMVDNQFGGISPDFNKPVFKNPLLEEYVDGLHFVLSIGIEHEFVDEVLEYFEPHFIQDHKDPNVTKQFNSVFEAASGLHGYESLLYSYLALGEMLEFTQDEIEEAYMAKNAINHKRQESGY
ncbi:dUTP diphosphatase [Mesobacillus stamsii]|uniref:Dimeric dUTPase (All-alpha-NTP-PPase superfamily) n=1 Tax=Mesobacillus stamsii TaxID=225347 RepID=A0ABU0FRZ7_9BACI|nr:dUTP diphosphatase [Mesobacillus stamsii]MDQ0412693.1 dimeric dUTPase (all-alpha-NTP-PPase superfamily) [Mesobacillus stamsii]